MSNIGKPSPLLFFRITAHHTHDVLINVVYVDGIALAFAVFKKL